MVVIFNGSHEHIQRSPREDLYRTQLCFWNLDIVSRGIYLMV